MFFEEKAHNITATLTFVRRTDDPIELDLRMQ